ncbi:MAG: hypothetical protein RIS29_715, partial [Bacteroidota bacterium]
MLTFTAQFTPKWGAQLHRNIHSDAHKNLIKKYFPDDKVAQAVLAQNCFLRPSGASSFSDFEYLTISQKGDTVEVNYKLMDYNRGVSKLT